MGLSSVALAAADVGGSFVDSTSRRAAVGLCGLRPAPLRVAAMRLRSLTPSAVGWPPACALRLPVSRLFFWWGWLAVPFILAHRSRRQGLSALWALAAVRPSLSL